MCKMELKQLKTPTNVICFRLKDLVVVNQTHDRARLSRKVVYGSCDYNGCDWSWSLDELDVTRYLLPVLCSRNYHYRGQRVKDRFAGFQLKATSEFCCIASVIQPAK